MVIKKITVGFVVQEFDTNSKKFVRQEFVAGDECTYELDSEELDTKEVEKLMGKPEPYLPFDMVQPS